jgi:uncharacterized membrane protein
MDKEINMVLFNLHDLILVIQQCISFVGVFIIFSGVLLALYRYLSYALQGQLFDQTAINLIRLNLGKVLVLGLEFIVAADLIGTTTAPDYYSLGMVAGIVCIRTVLSFTLNRELASLSQSTASVSNR